MKDTIALGLHKKKPSSKTTTPSVNSQDESVKPDESDFLYKKLEKKWGLDKIDETEDEKAFMKDLLDQSPTTNPANTLNKSNLPQSEMDARERFI